VPGSGFNEREREREKERERERKRKRRRKEERKEINSIHITNKNVIADVILLKIWKIK
jgi:ribosomal protein L18